MPPRSTGEAKGILDGSFRGPPAVRRFDFAEAIPVLQNGPRYAMPDSVAKWLAGLNGSGIEKPVNRLFADTQKGRCLTCRNFVAHAAFLLVAGFTLFW
jgi:hypothetical protein